MLINVDFELLEKIRKGKKMSIDAFCADVGMSKPTYYLIKSKGITRNIEGKIYLYTIKQIIDEMHEKLKTSNQTPD